MLLEQKIREIVKQAIRNLLFEEEKDNLIEPTVAFVRQKYNEFNAAYFNGFLPKCSISIKPLGEKSGHVIAGTFRFTSTSGMMNLGDGKFLYFDSKTDQYHSNIGKNNIGLLKPVITINSKYKAPIKQLENTIIHEMCHFYTYFNEDGSFRIPSSENNHHGPDFFAAAEMVGVNSNGKIKITDVLSAEEVEALAASSYFEKGEYKICTTEYNGNQIIWYTKYPSIWIECMFSLFSTINVTNDSELLMQLKRYKYSPSTYRNKRPQAYNVNGSPKPLIDAFNNAKFVTVTKENYDEIFGDDE